MMEQRLIDANKLVFEEIEGSDGDYYDVIYSCDVYNAPVVMTIPNNATNGDMIKVLFPDIEIEGIGGLEGLQCVAVSIGLGTSYFSLDWWNAPYKTAKWINFAEELKDVFEEVEQK